jgi:hypothetical protein
VKRKTAPYDEKVKNFTISLPPSVRQQAEDRAKALYPTVQGFSHYIHLLILTEMDTNLLGRKAARKASTAPSLNENTTTKRQ